MRKFFVISATAAAVLLFTAQLKAQTAQQTAQQQAATVTGNAAVPVTTVVPVQQQPVKQTEYTTVVVPQQQQQETRPQRRAHKAEQFASRLDSLVRSGSFVFYPSTMQDMSSGMHYTLIADYFYFGLFTDSAEVHLPVVNSSLDQMYLLNFDAPVNDLRFYTFQSGVSVTFALQDNGKKCFARFVASSVTGETTLMLVTPESSMRYVGWLSVEKLHEE